MLTQSSDPARRDDDDSENKKFTVWRVTIPLLPYIPRGIWRLSCRRPSAGDESSERRHSSPECFPSRSRPERRPWCAWNRQRPCLTSRKLRKERTRKGFDTETRVQLAGGGFMLTFSLLSVVLSEEGRGDFQVVLEGLGRVRVLQVCGRRENNVAGDDMSINNLLVNGIGARWRLLGWKR